jgi:hypothetical protein
MPPLPVPPSVENAFGEGSRILLIQLPGFDPAPLVAMRGRSRRVPLSVGEACRTYPPAFPVLAMVVVVDNNGRR